MGINLTLYRLKTKAKLCYGRRLVGQSILVSSTHLGPKTRFLLLVDSCGFVDKNTCLSFTNAADPRQRSHSGVRVPRGSRS
jgi:hypothetical protein